MPDPLTDIDLAILQGVLNDSPGRVRTAPFALSSPTVGHMNGGRIRFDAQESRAGRSAGVDIADQVLPAGWVEVNTGYPMERVFDAY